MEYSQVQELRQALSDWVSDRPWDWYATLTFRREVRNTSIAKRNFGRFTSWLGKVYEVDPKYFLAVERFRDGWGTHLHALLWVGGPNMLGQAPLIRPAWEWWFRKYGMARIMVYDSGLGASYYLSKYLTKDLCDWDFRF